MDADSRTASPVQPVLRSATDLHAVLRHTTAMLDSADEREVLWAAMAAVSALGPFTVEAAYLLRDGQPQRCPPPNAAVRGAPRPEIPTAAAIDQLLDAQSGGSWIRAFALRHHDNRLGYLVIRARSTPSAEETALADLLAQQTGIALAQLAQRQGEHRHSEEGDQPRTGAARLDADPGADLSAAISVLECQRDYLDTLSRVAASGRGEQGIVQTLHEHTGLPAMTEDRYGNLRAWSGPGRPPRNPVPALRPRDELLHAVRHRPGAIRDRDRLIAPIEMAGDLLGLVALVDPDRRAAEADASALEQAGLALAPGLAHEHRLAELEPQLRRDLVEELISGRATEDAFARAATFGHDLHRPQCVAVLRWHGLSDQAALNDAVARAAKRLRLDVLVGTRAERTVVLAAGLDAGDALYRAVSDDLGTPAGAVGVGGRCDGPADLLHSYDEAERALTVRRKSHDPHGSTSFEELGLYRMVGTGDGEREADRFVREWLGALLDYDRRHHSDLVATLTHYLETGGSYDATAEILLIHRSTVRYRLQRIREITGHNVNDVETRLNLHVATRIRTVLDQPR
ncbi:hypothetical protein ABIA33_006469 [Streptacidiphilus sp. MAP12-16]|uniref:PucR family transcriptional regulator n=1 Tax=Streptacidiphilus sp. MAP12-16 TaxID=3156300 RepID=UPI003517C00D